MGSSASVFHQNRRVSALPDPEPLLAKHTATKYQSTPEKVQRSEQVHQAWVMPVPTQPASDRNMDVTSNRHRGDSVLPAECTWLIRETTSINTAKVEEVKQSVSFKSLDFEPDEQPYASDGPFPPCAPTQRRHIRRLEHAMKTISRNPCRFEQTVILRRQNIA